MAEGIRIRHHTRRSQVVAVPMLSLPLKGKRTVVCPFCGETHLCKVAHLLVDGEGTAIVARQVWELMSKHAPQNGGFTIVNPVKKPPAQTMKPDLKPVHVKAFDLDDGTRPVHTVDTDTAVRKLKEAVPEATEEQIRAFLVAKVLEQGPAVSER